MQESLFKDIDVSNVEKPKIDKKEKDELYDPVPLT